MQGPPFLLPPFLATFVCLGKEERRRKPAARRVDSQHSPRHSKQQEQQQETGAGWQPERARAALHFQRNRKRSHGQARTFLDGARARRRRPQRRRRKFAALLAGSVCLPAATTEAGSGRVRVRLLTPQPPLSTIKFPSLSLRAISRAERHTHEGASPGTRTQPRRKMKKHRREPAAQAAAEAGKQAGLRACAAAGELAHTHAQSCVAAAYLSPAIGPARPPRLPSIYQRPCQ